MTIHSGNPFPEAPDELRRFRGRLGGAVSLWTSGTAGLTVSSLMVAAGEPGRLLGLIDPDSDLMDALGETGRAVVQLLEWQHRDLAEAFAGRLPAPGGAFRMASWEETGFGPRLQDATTWAGVLVEDVREVGWSSLVTCTVGSVVVGDDEGPLFHRRGRYSSG